MILILATPGPRMYQLIHPWHWLAYGNNSSGIAALSSVITAIAAILTLTLVVRYTRDTSRMTKINEDTYKLSIRPRLFIETPELTDDLYINFEIKNIGKGQAESSYSMVFIAPPGIPISTPNIEQTLISDFSGGDVLGSVPVDRTARTRQRIEKMKMYLIILKYKDVEGNPYETRSLYLRNVPTFNMQNEFL